MLYCCCDSRGLIRHASLDEIEECLVKKLYQRPGTLAYVAILLMVLCGIIYGLAH